MWDWQPSWTDLFSCPFQTTHPPQWPANLANSAACSEASIECLPFSKTRCKWASIAAAQVACRPWSPDMNIVHLDLNIFWMSINASYQAVSLASFFWLFTSDFCWCWTWYGTLSFCLLCGGATPDKDGLGILRVIKVFIFFIWQISHCLCKLSPISVHIILIANTVQIQVLYGIFILCCSKFGFWKKWSHHGDLWVIAESSEWRSITCYNKGPYDVLACSWNFWSSWAFWHPLSWVRVLFLMYPNKWLASTFFHSLLVTELLQSSSYTVGLSGSTCAYWWLKFCRFYSSSSPSNSTKLSLSELSSTRPGGTNSSDSSRTYIPPSHAFSSSGISSILSASDWCGISPPGLGVWCISKLLLPAMCLAACAFIMLTWW